MKAIVYDEYGGPDVLRMEDVEKPEPTRDQVLICIRAVEATKADCEIRSFKFAVSWFWLPLRLALGLRKPRNRILGNYFAGVVEAVGNDVSKFQKGQSIFGAAGLRMGAYAEYLCITDKHTMVTIPNDMTFEAEASSYWKTSSADTTSTLSNPKEMLSISLSSSSTSCGRSAS